MGPEVAKLARERDLFRQLLELGLNDDPETFVEKALSLFIDAAGARRGCLELRDPSDETEAPTFFIARGLEEADLVADGFSPSVITETLPPCQTVLTPSPLTDPP